MIRRFLIMGVLGVVPTLCCGYPCCILLADETTAAMRAALGAETRVPTPNQVKTYRLSKSVGKVQGQYVSGMDKSGPAEKAGLKVGDVLLALDANKIYSRDDIEDFLRVAQPGAKVKMQVKRAGMFQEETVPITLGAKAPAADSKHFTWHYAGLGQLDVALAAANRESKSVLVGLSGADT